MSQVGKVDAKVLRQREANRSSYLKHRDKRLAERAKYRRNNKDKVSEGISRWREKNREKVRAQNLKWKADNKDKVRADNAAWRVANKEKTRACWHRYRARKIASCGTVSRDICEVLIKSQKGKCVYCLRLLKNTGVNIDHIYPLANGGTHNDNNIQLLCPTCNKRKGAKDPITFAQQNGMLL